MMTRKVAIATGPPGDLPSPAINRPHASPAREAALQKQHNEYLEEHPEVKKLLADFISSALVEQPVDVFEFAQAHFKGTATVVEEDEEEADAEEAAMGGEMGAAAADDQDDLDDLDEMAAGHNQELTAYLHNVFNSIDADGSGTISKNELNEKLKADTELQTLLEAAGGDGQWFVLEQLDLDGDGEITWLEFEAMLGDRNKFQ